MPSSRAPRNPVPKVGAAVPPEAVEAAPLGSRWRQRGAAGGPVYAVTSLMLRRADSAPAAVLRSESHDAEVTLTVAALPLQMERLAS